jgi:glycerol-3-phosphate acyltransferase PlsY
MAFFLILVAYLLGAIPMGYVTVKLFKGEDITTVGSGRTGGTNAMRAGGILVGILTGALDLLKGFLAVWLVRWFFPDALWMQAFAGVTAVFGHNWSVWIYLKNRRWSAGAGTGPNVGAATAFWPWTLLLVIPLIIFFILVVGYASVASIAVALAILITFIILALVSGFPVEYVVFSLLTAILVVWALRPNIARLVNGTERRVGLFAGKITGEKG